MSSKRRIQLTFAGTEESITEAVRQVTADKALKYINKITTEILCDNNSLNMVPGVRPYSYYTYGSERMRIEQSVLLTGWGLLDLAYQIILHSNDFRGVEITSDDEIAALLHELSAYHVKWEEKVLAVQKRTRNGKNDSMFYVWGFWGEQFKYQNLESCLSNAGRELYILFECSRHIDTKIDIEQIVIDEAGIPWKEIVAYFFLAWFISTQKAEVLDIENIIHWSIDFSYDKYVNLINKYTSTYDEIRSDKERGRQIFYCKPYVKTQKQEIISVNTFINLMFYEHSIFWIIRDHYEKRQSQSFVNEFGRFFEEYFKLVLESCLSEKEYSRIPEQDRKRADWRIVIGDYKFLVEQKSAFLGLSVKQPQTDIQQLKQYSINNVVKGLRQLKETEEDFHDEKYIKIILLYEEYLKAEILDSIFELEQCDVEDDRYYWLVTISEMEKLLQFSKDDRAGFYSLIQEKLDLEQIKSKDGRSLEQLLSKRGIIKNKLLNQKCIQKYRNMAQNIVQKHVDKR